jgi:hypothetical protein
VSWTAQVIGLGPPNPHQDASAGHTRRGSQVFLTPSMLARLLRIVAISHHGLSNLATSSQHSLLNGEMRDERGVHPRGWDCY